MPRFHGILLTRDDEDIIGQNIVHALGWCDALYIFETGGFDSTWELVCEYARRDKRITCFQNQHGQALMESGLRGYVFERFRDRMEDRDWVVQVDSDEFYHVSPREFVASYVRTSETAVFNATFEFRLTKREVDDWVAGRETIRDRGRAITERRRYYNILLHTEPRMFRYRHTMQWPPNIAYPYNMGFAARNRIPIRHYPQRDALQLQKRWALRSILASQADPNWKHWRHTDWRELIAMGDETELYYWRPDGNLPVENFPSHLPRWPKRFLQRLVHSGPLSLMDKTRPKFPVAWNPKLLSPKTVQSIADAYRLLDSCGGRVLPTLNQSPP